MVCWADAITPFVLNAPLASVAWNAPGHRLSEPSLTALIGASPPAVVSVPSPSLAASFTHQASAGVDRELAPDLTVAANAVYARGFNQPIHAVDPTAHAEIIAIRKAAR